MAWYHQDEKGAATEVSSLIDKFRDEQFGRRDRYLYNLSLFEGRKIVGNASIDYVSEVGDAQAWINDDPLRLIRSATQTGVAEIYARQKPKPQFMTSGADWRTRRKAKKADKACEGVLAQRQGRWIDVWALMADAGIECILQGVAAIRVLSDPVEKRLVHELIPVIDLYCDPLEGREPRNLFYAQPIDVEVAKQVWCEGPRAAKKIDDATYYRRLRAIDGAPEFWRFNMNAGQRPRVSKVIRQDSAWFVSSSKETKGRYVVSIAGECMQDCEWDAPSFPFVFLRWEDHRDGFWSSGLADEGRGLAADAGEMDWRLLRRMIVASGKRTYYFAGSINPRDLTCNDEEVLVEVQQGQQPPIETVVPALAPGETEYAQYRVQLFWNALGISQTSAAARREPGVESGTAIRTLNDIKTGRQIQKAQRYEQAFVDLAHQYMWRFRELAEDDQKFCVSWPGKTVLVDLKFEQFDITKDTFTVRVAPASNLPNDPAGRQQMVQDLFHEGLISPDTAKALIGWPDLEKELEGSQAEGEYVDMLIDRYLDAEEKHWDSDEDYESPSGIILNKERALLRFSQAMFQARIELAQASRESKREGRFAISLLVRYIRELEFLLSQARQSEAMLGQPAQPGAMAPPPLPVAQTQPMPIGGPPPMAA